MQSERKARFWVPGAVPLLLIGIGLLHSVVGFMSGANTIRGMIDDGLWGSMDADTGPPSPSFLLWFLMSGFFLILLGHLGLWIERRLKQPLPIFFGLEFLIIAAAALVVHGGALPGWIFVVAAIWVLVVRFASRRHHTG